MKKFLSFLLIFILSLSAFVSCASDNKEYSSFSDSGSSESSSQSLSDELDFDDDDNDNDNSDKSSENKALTKFEKQFSVENEARLEKILARTLSTTDVTSSIPSLSVSPKKKMPAGDNAQTYVYEGATLKLYKECCDKLYSANFAQYTETEFNGTAHNSSKAVKNYFTTFLSSAVQVDIELHESASRMYLTATPRTASALPERETPKYTKPAGNFPVIWTQFGLEDVDDAESSLGYIIRLADGSFIIIDGGEWFGDDSKNNAVAKRIYDILKKQAPNPNNIVIAAWIITHAHNDHAGAFYNFQVAYDKDTSIKIKQMIHNFPDKTLLNSGDYNYQVSVIDSAAKFVHKPETLKPHTGNVLYYPGMKINVLYTQENYLAVGADFTGNYNCSSLVLQFVTDDGTKILLGADHPVSGVYEGTTWCEGAIYNWYGSFIESQVVSLFHHGYGGGADETVYYVIKPKIILWPSDLARINSSNVKKFAHNSYFSGSNPQAGVKYYIPDGSRVQIMSFANGTPTIKEYANISTYLSS